MSQVTCPGRNRLRREGAVQSLNAPPRREGGARRGGREMLRGDLDTQAADGWRRLRSLERILGGQPGGVRWVAERTGPWGWRDLGQEVPGEGAPPGGLSDQARGWGRPERSGPGRGACRVAGAGVRGDLRCPDQCKAGSRPRRPTHRAPPCPPGTGRLSRADPSDARPTHRHSGDLTGESLCRWPQGNEGGRGQHPACPGPADVHEAGMPAGWASRSCPPSWCAAAGHRGVPPRLEGPGHQHCLPGAGLPATCPPGPGRGSQSSFPGPERICPCSEAEGTEGVSPVVGGHNLPYAAPGGRKTGEGSKATC